MPTPVDFAPACMQEETYTYIMPKVGHCFHFTGSEQGMPSRTLGVQFGVGVDSVAPNSGIDTIGRTLGFASVKEAIICVAPFKIGVIAADRSMMIYGEWAVLNSWRKSIPASSLIMVLDCLMITSLA